MHVLRVLETDRMPKRGRSKKNSAKHGREPVKVRADATSLSETNCVIKFENISIEDELQLKEGELKDSGQHAHLVEKDLLEFTNSLSKKIGARRKNVLSALLNVTTDTLPAPQEPLGPIHGCLCELKGKEDGTVVICNKNCNCIIHLEPCHCGFEHPDAPSEVTRNKRPRLSKDDQNNSVPMLVTGNDVSKSQPTVTASFTEKLKTELPDSSLGATLRRCTHIPYARVIRKKQFCHGPSKVGMHRRSAGRPQPGGNMNIT